MPLDNAADAPLLLQLSPPSSLGGKEEKLEALKPPWFCARSLTPMVARTGCLNALPHLDTSHSLHPCLDLLGYTSRTPWTYLLCTHTKKSHPPLQHCDMREKCGKVSAKKGEKGGEGMGEILLKPQVKHAAGLTACMSFCLPADPCWDGMGGNEA